MATSDYETTSSGGGMWWLYAPIILILFLGGALSVGAYAYGEPDLTIMESIAAGFAGLAAIIVGLFAAAFGILVGLVGALFGIAVGGGAVALTLFILASPVIAIVLFVLLLNNRNRGGADCPDPGVHE